MSAELRSLLQQSRFGALLPDAVLDQIARFAELRHFQANEILFREGQEYENILILTEGRVALEMHVPGRGNVRILSLGPGDLVAWSAVIADARMTSTCRAIEATTVLLIPARELLAQCEADPNMGYALMKQVGAALANRLVATRLQLLDLFSDSTATVSAGVN